MSISIGGGSGALNVEANAKLAIYAPGDISIAGNGIKNGGTTAGTCNQPINVQIWGTKTTGTQTIAAKGNGVLSAVVYAPQGSVTVVGNGDVMGSVVANDITVAGNANFHHDEALANVGGNNPFRVSLRRELTTAAQRHAVHRRVPRTARRGFAAPCADRAGAAGTPAITGHCKPCAMAPPWAAPA